MNSHSPKSFNKVLFPYLENINIRERRDLEYFMKIPSNPSSKEELKIAEHILENARNKKPNIEAEIIKKFFDSSERSKKAWQKVKHRIQQTFLRYYTMRKLEKHPMEGIFLAEIYDKYGLKDKKKSEIKRQRKKLKNLLDPNRVLYEYWFLEMSIDEQKKKRENDDDLDAMEKKLDEFYLEKKFRYLLEKTNRKDIVSDPSLKSSERDYSDFTKWSEQKMDHIDSIKSLIYYKLYLLLKSEGDIIEAKSIESLVEESYDSIDTQTLEESYTCLLNYYIKNINKGDDSYAKSYLDCLSKMLNQGIVFTNKELSIAILKNSVGIALIHDDIDRAWKLLKQHEKKPSYQKGEGKYILCLTKATVLLYESKYVESFNTMKPYKLKDYYHDIDAQLLKLQLEYSLGQYDSLIKNIELLKKRIKKQGKIPDIKKKYYLVFLDALQQLNQDKKLNKLNFEGKIAKLKWRWLKKMDEKERN